jgi:hypothetical protein
LNEILSIYYNCAFQSLILSLCDNLNQLITTESVLQIINQNLLLPLSIYCVYEDIILSQSCQILQQRSEKFKILDRLKNYNQRILKVNCGEFMYKGIAYLPLLVDWKQFEYIVFPYLNILYLQLYLTSFTNKRSKNHRIL